MEPLICPICKSELKNLGDRFNCINCELSGTINDGIYDFLGDCDNYWGEISPNEMEETLEFARKNGWRMAAKDVGFKHHNLNSYLLNNTRIDWLFHCLNRSETQSCLDVGSGWGVIPFCLAKYYDEVWSLEAVKQRLEFQRIRKHQDNIKNIHLIRSDWLSLPFPDNYFDLVSANGIFEWIGLSDFGRNPRDLQLEFLVEVHRVLRPGGCLYIGIENRFGLSFIIGGKDHSGLSFTSILPRKFADIAVKLFRNNEREYIESQRMSRQWNRYHTYTYSYLGYKKILEEVHFNEIDLYWTLNYNNPKYAGKLGDEGFRYLLRVFGNDVTRVRSLRSLLKSIAPKIPNCLVRRVLPIVCPSYLIFAHKDRKGINFETRILQLNKSSNGFIRLSGSQGINSKIMYLLLNRENPLTLVKFPRFPDGISSLKKEEDLIAKFNNNFSLKKENIDGIDIFVEPYLNGFRPEIYNLHHNKRILEWLLDFQNKTQKGYWDLKSIENNFRRLIEQLYKVPIKNDIRERTIAKMDNLLESLSRINLPINSEHGDFSLRNMIIDQKEELYIIDWEMYQENGDPLFDFVFYNLVNSADSLTTNFSGIGPYSIILKNLIFDFAKAKGLNPELIIQSVPYVILKCIYRSSSSDEELKHIDSMRYINWLIEWDKIKTLNNFF